MDLIEALADPVSAVVPAAYQAAAKAKLERDRKSYLAFRDVDQREHDRRHAERHAKAVAEAEENEGFWRLDVEELGPKAETALAAARTAEDRARSAREYARQQREAYERLRDDGTALAEEETGALLKADAAEKTAQHAEDEAENAAGESREVDAALAEARNGLAVAERESADAREQAKAPAGTAPFSDVTMRACSAFMQRDEVWDQLSDREKWRVRQAGEPRDMLSAAEFRARLRETFGGAAEAV